uniref:t-SNARE coiled-coil homology domain-containing protein n=1 Tax=Timema cristinae TaxID=61476 RepID=A0A7R9D1V0_TIMCR|nr:unnamed protein product [Timema cristinae]
MSEKSLEAQLSLDAAKARHEELSKIEKSIAEIKDVFVEIALLVEDQGSKLDSIEHHVNKAMGNSVHGTKKLEKAKKRKRKYKRVPSTTYTTKCARAAISNVESVAP